MKGIFLTPPAQGNPPGTTASLMNAWQVGQILKVRAETDSSAAGQLMLRIGKLKVAATTPLPIKAGEAFSAQIQSLGQTPVLKILSTPGGPQRAIARYLRESLPRQQDFAPLMQKLATTAGKDSSLPQPVKSLAQSIIGNMASMDNLKRPGEIKSAITGSGVLLEARLAGANLPQTTLPADLKAQLLQLRRTLIRQLAADATPAGQASTPGADRSMRTAPATSQQQVIDLFISGRLAPETLVRLITRDFPADQVTLLLRYLESLTSLRQPAGLSEPLVRLAQFIQAQTTPAVSAESLLALLRNILALQELQQLTENALNRIQASQLSSVSREAGTAFLLHLDLPVMHDKAVQNLQLQFEKRGEDEASPEHWNVTINIDLPELGPIQARLRLQENRLVTRFEAEQAGTVLGIRKNLPLLQEALARIGVTIDHLSVEQGKAETGLRPPPPGQHLLDEMA